MEKKIVEAKGIKCEIENNENGLPSFKVIGYTDNNNIPFMHEKGDVIKPDVNDDVYATLLINTKGDETNEWKTHYATNYIVYKKICSFDKMSFTTLKETREALNEDLETTVGII